jgi:hypothetical protein
VGVAGADEDESFLGRRTIGITDVGAAQAGIAAGASESAVIGPPESGAA